MAVSATDSTSPITATNRAGLIEYGNSSGASAIVQASSDDVASDITAPIITGPSGGAGASNSAITISENTPVVTTMTANESVTWSKSGTDAALVNIGSGTGGVTLVAGAGANFEDPTDAGANNTIVVVLTATDAAANASSQTLTITVINANEAPVFAGPSISIPSGVAGAALTPIALASLWTDPDAGDTFTYTKGGTWPGSVDIVGGQITGTYPATLGTVSGLTVNRVDAGGLSTPSNSFSITSTAAPGGATCTILDWVLPTDSQHNVGEVWNISFHSAANRVLALHVPSAALVAGLNGAGQPSRNLVVQNAAFVAGTTYDWFATHPTNTTWFASGKVTAA